MIIIFILFTIMLLFVSAFKSKINSYEAFTNKKQNNNNVFLIGDSMLNNSAFVSQDQSVPDLLSNQLVGSTVYNFAKDGATIADCYAQLDKLFVDSNATIFVSCGGNNILNSRETIKTENVTNLFAEYSKLLKSIQVRTPNASLHVLNLYTPTNGHYTSYFPAIKQWNQLLDDNSSNLGYTVLQMDNLLVSDEDFVYGIEPSFKGGQKLVSKIVSVL